MTRLFIVQMSFLTRRCISATEITCPLLSVILMNEVVAGFFIRSASFVASGYLCYKLSVLIQINIIWIRHADIWNNVPIGNQICDSQLRVWHHHHESIIPAYPQTASSHHFNLIIADACIMTCVSPHTAHICVIYMYLSHKQTTHSWVRMYHKNTTGRLVSLQHAQVCVDKTCG